MKNQVMVDTKEFIKNGSDESIDALTLQAKSPSVSLKFNLPANVSDQSILNALDRTCAQYVANTQFGERLKFMIGRILILARHRQIWKNKNLGTWLNFDGFIQSVITERYGIGRTTAFESMKVAELLPDIPPDQAERIGSTNLVKVAKTIDYIPMERRPQLKDRLLANAEIMSLAQFDEFIKTDSELTEYQVKRPPRVETPKPTSRTVSIQVSEETYEQWNDLLNGRNPTEVFMELIKLELKRVTPAKKRIKGIRSRGSTRLVPKAA